MPEHISPDHPPLSIATVQQLRADGWSEAKIATAAKRKAAREATPKRLR